MNLITEPSSQVRQMSGLNFERQSILSVLVKRTYQILDNSQCVLADEQMPLIESAETYKENQSMLDKDSDLFPFKLMTDVIVKGHAYPTEGQKRSQASIQIRHHRKVISVIGDRQYMLNANGKLIFSEPKALDPIPLRYDFAYGGRDTYAERFYKSPFKGWEASLPENFNPMDCSPYIYPRNPFGKGYLMSLNADAIETLELPNLEDPNDPLTPDRIIAGKPENWPRMPMPQAMDWVNYDAFPRAAFFGIVAEHEPVNYPVAEVSQGYVEADIMQPGSVLDKFSLRCTNGASLGLQLPYLMGDDEVILEGLHPKKSEVYLTLPKERPRIWTDGRNGKMNETQPVIHSVIIEPDESRLSIVWRGAARALRPYMIEELEKMPLRVEWH